MAHDKSGRLNPLSPKYAFFRIAQSVPWSQIWVFSYFVVLRDQRLFSLWVARNAILTHSITLLVLEARFLSYKTKRLDVVFTEKIRVENMFFAMYAILLDQFRLALFSGVHCRRSIFIVPGKAGKLLKRQLE